MKKILALFLIFLLIFFIYLSTIDRKVYFLTLSSNTKIPYIDKIIDDLREKNSLEKYVKEFSRSVKRSPLLTRRSLREIVKIARRS